MNTATCKHCGQLFDLTDKPSNWMANHSRWCDSNPKRSSYKNGSIAAVSAMNAKRKETGVTNQFTKAKKLNLPIPEGTQKGKGGTFKGKKHSEKSKQAIKLKALASSHRRLKKGTIEYKGVTLDSSWELALAKRLDELKIEWNRPNPIKWIDDVGLAHNYFPDFYLPEYDMYLDPKNPIAYNSQINKINKLLTAIPNLVIITTLEECKSFTV